MKSDPELCEKVAVACGAKRLPDNSRVWEFPSGRRYSICETDNGGSKADWTPDTDWNHAMQAAEWFGLFDNHKLLNDLGDVVVCIAVCEFSGEVVARGVGPGVICAAIAALAETGP